MGRKEKEEDSNFLNVLYSYFTKKRVFAGIIVMKGISRAAGTRERGHLLAAEKQHFHKAACHVTLSSRFLIGAWLGCFRLTFTSASAKACCYVLFHCRPHGSQLKKILPLLSFASRRDTFGF